MKYIYIFAIVIISIGFYTPFTTAMTTEDMVVLYGTYTHPNVLGASATSISSNIPSPLNPEQQKTIMKGLSYAVGSSAIVSVPLKEGNKSDAVKNLQMFLGAKNYFTSDVTGFFGPKTKMAVKAFQLAKGLKSDGVVGPSTRSAISGEVAMLIK